MGSENEVSNASLEESSRLYQNTGVRRGIQSSWNGGKADPGPRKYSDAESETGDVAKNKLVDVGLESQTEDDFDDPPADLTGEFTRDHSPPAFQEGNPRSHRFLQTQESTAESDLAQSARTSLDGGRNQHQPPAPDAEVFVHDPFWAWLYLVGLACMMTTYVLVWLHTEAPDRKHPLGDTIYSTLHKAFYMLTGYTVAAIATALIWLAALRSFARPLVNLIILAVPTIMVSFSLYPFISSFQGSDGGKTVQDNVMRWASIVPMVGAIVWVYCVYKARYAIKSAIQIVEFSSKILTQNSALIIVGLVHLFIAVLWTWLWIIMFSRVFLGDKSSGRLARYIISTSSWWLGTWFIFMYTWTISILSESHRATTAAVVSHWYFHRSPTGPPSHEVVKAAIVHTFTNIFGSICESTLLARLVRLPLLLLPARLSYILQRVVNQFIPTPVVALTNPLTITYCAIHSQNLASSARGLSQMEFLAPQRPTATLTPRVFTTGDHHTSGLLPYRLAKLFLYSSRFIVAIPMFYAGWVLAAKKLQIDMPEGVGLRGSAYGYIVGIVASFIGYTVMASMESILAGIVDAAIICYGIERRINSDGGARYCIEAAALFGEQRARYGSDYV